MKPHKHAELIKQWADGAEIQRFEYYYGTWITHGWCDLWHHDFKYRLKPVPKPDVVRYTVVTPESVDDVTSRKWDVDNLKLTFDGETLELIKAEVMHKQKAP
jgi:hypothetical protein